VNLPRKLAEVNDAYDLFSAGDEFEPWLGGRLFRKRLIFSVLQAKSWDNTLG
jgi:hypothetical protein